MKRFSISVLVVLGLAAKAIFAGGAMDQVKVYDPYARAVPPGQPNGAVFMSLSNGSDQEHALVGAESQVAASVELHNHIRDGDMMRMRREDRIELGAGETVTLQPGGLHVMLIGLTRQLEPGQRVDVTLIFEDGSRARVEAPVRRISVGGGKGKPPSCGSGRCGAGRCGGGN